MLFASSEVRIDVDPSPVDRENPKYLTSYAPVLKPARDAVVSVHTSRIIRIFRAHGMDPREEALRRFLGLPLPQGQQVVEERLDPVGIGSGVVISPDGYILTNNHVVITPEGREADDVLVELNDGRELEARVVGRDPQSDLAVLKIDATALPHITFADSELLEVGDIAFAIGNPMGVGLTITQGIISATGRSNLSILGDSGNENFIQTDAPINPGNSGGALVDAYGRLIGINTAILSRSGGSIGIGFAIPSNFAHTVARSIIEYGEMRRGMLGVNVTDLTKDTREAFAFDGVDGVLVQSVMPNLPADKAGLKKGDIILRIGDKEIRDARMLRLVLAALGPDEVLLTYLRDGREAELRVRLVDRKDPYGLGARHGEFLPGVEALAIDRESRRQYGLPAALEGLLLTAVSDHSPYAEILRPGAVVLHINGETPLSVDQGLQLLRSRPVSHLYIYFQGRSGYISVRRDD
ncbi:trypsin-like peptidase domain-containing protein [Coraliomargarita parva]|uniref:trypsin-like peptidase domain-containing protein n=1 Tax=Coraliomargarita parva TaxID=3014050 RepID=UPI0022B4E657|nr:trypsin-like peptidase domain-containing protein [Coraliomargarita parva]